MEGNNGNKEGNTYLSKEEKLNRLFLSGVGYDINPHNT